MPYGRIYIENLRKKVNAIFDILQGSHNLNKESFKMEFKSRYPEDYAMLQYEYEFKQHEFRKNRRGNPKPQPTKPEEILDNMYENYYFKIITYPVIKQDRRNRINIIKINAGQRGYKIKDLDNNSFNVIKKDTKEIVAEKITYEELKTMFPVKIKKKYKQKENVKEDRC